MRVSRITKKTDTDAHPRSCVGNSKEGAQGQHRGNKRCDKSVRRGDGTTKRYGVQTVSTTVQSERTAAKGLRRQYCKKYEGCNRDEMSGGGGAHMNDLETSQSL